VDQVRNLRSRLVLQIRSDRTEAVLRATLTLGVSYPLKLERKVSTN
jgi:hypothetical protein